MLCHCADVRHSLSWKTQVFVRVPAPVKKARTDPATGIVEAEGWRFKHVAACPRQGEPVETHWWMAWPVDESSLRLGSASWWRMLTRGTAISTLDWGRISAATPRIAIAARSGLGAYPQMVQPDLIFKQKAVKKDALQCQDAHPGPDRRPHTHRVSSTTSLTLGSLPDGALWSRGPGDGPPYDPAWHQSEAHTQLQRAKKEVRASTGAAGRGITIGILDSGYDHTHLLVPRHTIGPERKGERAGDAINSLACASGLCHDIYPGETGGAHGMKAMSILAGGRLPVTAALKPADLSKLDSRVLREGVEFGAAPDATIVPARVAPWVFSHSPANLAYAIDYASRVKGCDVLSISHGGTPTPMWIDAVNAAYERGTAIFAATGDYMNLPCLNFGIIAPSATVYPAACRRVQAVAAVTANGSPYGKVDWRHRWHAFLNPLNWLPLRGSYGADGTRRAIGGIDKTQVDRGGILRPQNISTWSPNIAVARPPGKKDCHATDIFDMNWDGTSAAAPQAAGAAALWLARHRREIENAGAWQSWRKAEAVYVAMLRSAGGALPGQPGVDYQRREPDPFLGAGTLKAANMLRLSFAEVCRTHSKRHLTFPAKQTGMARDFFDGQRSGASMLGHETTYSDVSRRMDARRYTGDDLAAALKDIHANQLLVHEWNLGRTPERKQPREASPPSEARRESLLLRVDSWMRSILRLDEDEIDVIAEKLARRDLRSITSKTAASPR